VAVAWVRASVPKSLKTPIPETLQRVVREDHGTLAGTDLICDYPEEQSRNKGEPSAQCWPFEAHTHDRHVHLMRLFRLLAVSL
jgi:hypothetical protein